MKITMAQLSTGSSKLDNAKKAADMIRSAKGSDLIVFPEAQLTPFFPQYRACDLAEKTGLLPEDMPASQEGEEMSLILEAVRETGIWCSPNFYVQEKNGKSYDMSFMIDPSGNIIGRSKMVHVINAPQFYESDYYTPSEDGFKVFDTPFGKIGIVICFDRHIPESVRTCAKRGAKLILIPTVNTKSEPLELFDWEVRIQAFQNNVFIAMCNKVGKEGEMDFAGGSILCGPEGELLVKADDKEGLTTYEIDLSLADEALRKRPYIELLRPEAYV